MHQSDQHPHSTASVTSVSADAQVASDLNDPADLKDLKRTASLQGDLINLLRGFCMGVADTVPGISGGTIALIMGHYVRLVMAISRFDRRLLNLLSKRQFALAAKHVDLRFLAFLGFGLVVGAVTLARLMHYLLDAHLPETLAVFLGLLIASLWVVVQYVDRWSASRLVACGIGILFAASIAALPTGHGSTSLPFIFLAAAIAICAMILPGISGAYVLLVLGLYHHITGLIKGVLHLELTLSSVSQLAVFASGCLFGLLAFSRLLRKLLDRYPGTTMAALMGLMIGSAGKLWPLQVPTPETASLEPKYRVMRYVAPSDWQGNVWMLAALVVGSAAAMLAVEWIASRSHAKTPA